MTSDHHVFLMRVAVIAGAKSGVGRWMAPTIKLLEGVASKPLTFEDYDFTDTAAIRKADAALFGSVETPSALRKGEGLKALLAPLTPSKDYVSPIVTLRRELDLFAVVYPLPDDVLLVREATECLFVAKERMEGDVAIAERHVSKRASERVAWLAFLLAQKRHQNDDDVQQKFKRQRPRKEVRNCS